jgi:hypothetical protein
MVCGRSVGFGVVRWLHSTSAAAPSALHGPGVVVVEETSQPTARTHHLQPAPLDSGVR